METFLGNAERILETASTAGASSEYVLCVSRTGAIRILSDASDWSLPALAAEFGAAAVYRVRRSAASARVEGWSYGRNCVLTRDLSAQEWARSSGRTAYATRGLLNTSTGSRNDLSPQVWNS